MDEIICHCKQVTKSEISKAILGGAKTMKDIQEITGACTGNQCRELNPSGKCCSTEIQALLPGSDNKISTNSCGCNHC